MRLAFLTPAPDVPEPWHWAFDAEAAALTGAGIEVDPLPWTEVGDLSQYDLILPLLAWGYNRRCAQWLAFLDRLEQEKLPVVNPPAVLRWSSDKAYLTELDARGVPSVPTMVVEKLSAAALKAAAERFGTGELIVKPRVSAGADGTYRIRPGEALPDVAPDVGMMIQPFLESISGEGEYSLMLFDGVLSHAVVKRPARGDFRVQPHLGGVTERCTSPPGAEKLAQAALAVAPAAVSYARVDIIRGPNGALQIMELELVEPALFLDQAPDGAAAFTGAILAAAERAREQPLADR